MSEDEIRPVESIYGQLDYVGGPFTIRWSGDVSLCVPKPYLYDVGSASGFIPAGRWGLLDMINFRLDVFVAVVRTLAQEILIAMERAAADPMVAVDKEGDDRKRFDANFKMISTKCQEWVFDRACNRIERISMSLHRNPDYGYANLATDLTTLREGIEDDIKFERFFHYAPHRARPLLGMRRDWATTLAPTSFPSVENEIERGLDCFGFEDYDACVFHMMRVAEIGMRALARERRIIFPKHPLEWGDWQNIIEGIEKSVRAIGTGMPRGPAKDAAMAFYSGAVAQLHGFKDKFRNAVMHVRKSYDELEAVQAMNQVRDFMNGLSVKVGETTRRPIPLRRWP